MPTIAEGRLTALILDFDGVIVESVEIKTAAFRTMFAGYPDQVDAIVAFHEANAGVSRYEKFKVIYRDMLHEPCDEERLRLLGERFLKLVMEAVIRAPEGRGAHRFLTQSAQRYALFLVSGTPEVELVEIVQRRGLASFFQGVYGSPRSKLEMIRQILEANDWRPDQAVVIGDSLTDLRAAMELGVPFIGRVRPGGPNPFTSLREVPIIADLEELAQAWEGIVASQTMRVSTLERM